VILPLVSGHFLVFSPEWNLLQTKNDFAVCKIIQESIERISIEVVNELMVTDEEDEYHCENKSQHIQGNLMKSKP
jgi:hypothetical protein